MIRFFSLQGLGSGAGAALLAEVCRTSTTNERTSILSLCNGLRQIGLLTSPGFQLILEHLDFSLFHGTLMIKPYNASGLLMSGLWILFLIFVLIFYENINIEYSYELLRREHVGQDITGESLELSVSYCLLDNSEENANKSRSRQSWFYLDDIYRDTPVGLPVTWKVYLDGSLTLCSRDLKKKTDYLWIVCLLEFDWEFDGFFF